MFLETLEFGGRHGYRPGMHASTGGWRPQGMGRFCREPATFWQEIGHSD